MDKKTFDIENCRLNAERQRKVSERELEIVKIRLDYDGRIVAIEHERERKQREIRALNLEMMHNIEAVRQAGREYECEWLERKNELKKQLSDE